MDYLLTIFMNGMPLFFAAFFIIFVMGLIDMVKKKGNALYFFYIAIAYLIYFCAFPIYAATYIFMGLNSQTGFIAGLAVISISAPLFLFLVSIVLNLVTLYKIIRNTNYKLILKLSMGLTALGYIFYIITLILTFI